VIKGAANLGRHLRNVAKFGVPAVVGINRFGTDTLAEIEAIQKFCKEFGVEAVVCEHWAKGSEGIRELAVKVAALAEDEHAQFRTLYPDDMPLWEKVRTICREIYGADDAIADKAVRAQFAEFEKAGYGHFPVCMAKTQYSFSTDPNLRGAPSKHVVPVREVRLSAGAEFIVAVCGEIMTMPGLPKKPAAEVIGLNEAGEIVGLF